MFQCFQQFFLLCLIHYHIKNIEISENCRELLSKYYIFLFQRFFKIINIYNNFKIRYIH